MNSRLRNLCVRGLCLVAASSLTASAVAETNTLQRLKAGWDKPARTYKPHTRWWWPGNALTKADITWQMEQMAAQGMGGVEIMNTWKMYEKGNVEYLTPEFLELVKHAVAEGKRLDLDVAISFCPGWSFGGSWVAKADQSKALCMGSQELAGGQHFTGALPEATIIAKTLMSALNVPSGPGKLVAAVAGRITGKNRLDPDSLTVLSARVKEGSTSLDWDVPPGKWRLMAFWLKYTGQECQAQNFEPRPMVIDHLSKGAVQRYCDYLGGTFANAIGDEFGSTVDSFFCDSFEIIPPPDALLWSDETLAGFEKHSGYDFTKYLPALWCDIGKPTPRVRYDLGKYMSDLGLDAFFKTFNDWCDAHKVQARIQPYYRFTEELVQGAGATARPETEVTTARFEPVAGPAQGCRLRRAFLRARHRFRRGLHVHPSAALPHRLAGSEDSDRCVPARRCYAVLQSRLLCLAGNARCAEPRHALGQPHQPLEHAGGNTITAWRPMSPAAAALAPGPVVADVLIYSPQATAWSERALWGNDRRVMPYGNLAKTLVANGYDFDIVNDDLLQHRAQFRDGRVEINGYPYRRA